ncbi:alpha/beta hydrolase family protein [Nocardioides speluncae]|uniref:alpha/beta hydrolase family protein n=1 Tax=Nocardioides speluncae TaxID=2670337 RepID=UPI000D68A9F2|nr:hypothetical protein [Nocardioides speluncae]
MKLKIVALLAALVATSIGPPSAGQSTAPEPDLPPATCPDSLQAGTSCYSGQQASGSWYWIAVPEGWDGTLVLHAHGGPDLGEADPARSKDDLDRWSVMVREGYAWAGTSYRRGGYGTRMGATDVEQLHRLFAEHFGKPDTTLLHGQSWGGNIAAKAVEMFPGRYDGALLTNGVLGGGSRGYDYRVDLRVVYQYYCRNHPRPDEQQYPLWQGLRAGSTMTATGLRSRLQECTGYQSAPEERSETQRRNLANLLSVLRIPERTLYSHLSFATFTFRDIVHERLGDRNPFSNVGVRYRGSDDDRALNRGVQRYAADPGARRDLRFDSDLTGHVSIPVLSLHALDDPTAFVEHESAYRATLRGAGTDHHLVQAFTTEAEHSSLSDSEYATVVDALHDWVRGEGRPTRASLADDCPAFDATYGEGCFFDTTARPGSYFSRVYPRPGDTDWPAMSQWQYDRWEARGDVGIAY